MPQHILMLLAALLLTASFATVTDDSADQRPPGRDHAPQDYPRLEGSAIHFSGRFSLYFQRTLRIPDDGRQYPLPPGLGAFPVYRVEDYADRIPSDWQKSHAYFIPMYQREALWINFDAAFWKPNAVQVGIGRINALTGHAWKTQLSDDPQNYLVAPEQPWLDGIKAGEGYIRQFVAVPHGSGYSVEAQLRGEESDEALRIAVYEPKPGRFPDVPPYDDREVVYEDSPALAQSARSSSMGLGAGGKMRQKVYPDAHGLQTWQNEPAAEIVVYIINSEDFHAIVGTQPPASPIDAQTYTDYGYPWFALYDTDKADIPADDKLRNVKSTGTLDAQNGQGGDHTVVVPDSLVITLPQGSTGTPVPMVPPKHHQPEDPKD